MAETQSAPSLRELSEAATPGPWTAGTPGHGSVYGVYSGDRTGSIIGMFQHCYVFHRSHEQMIANAQFTARLETDYRAGRLIDPTTIFEAVAAARVEGVREGLERAAGIIEKSAVPALRGVSAAIRALIPAPPTTPGGRTDG